MNQVERKTILLVEDEAIIAMMETITLEKNGFRVLKASSGEKAVEIADTIAGIDLILMDINLGSGMDGTEAAKKILVKRDIPLAFLSSHTEKEVVETTEGITSYGYIVKNSGETVLIASIKMAFRLFEAKLREREKGLALRESEKRYRRLIDNSPDIVYVFSNRRGGVFYSPSVEKVLGHSLDHLYAHSFLWSESIHDDDRAKVEQAIHESGKGEPFALEYRIRDANGAWHWLYDRSIEQGSKDGETLIEGLATDITERKREEEKLLRKMDELERVHSLTVDRELAMIDLKREINGLLRRCGEADRYVIRTGPYES